MGREGNILECGHCLNRYRDMENALGNLELIGIWAPPNPSLLKRGPSKSVWFHVPRSGSSLVSGSGGLRGSVLGKGLLGTINQPTWKEEP